MMEAKDGQAWLGTNGYGSRREEDGVCHDDSATPVRANTVDELHSLQRKPQVVEDRHRLQLQSIRSCILMLPFAACTSCRSFNFVRNINGIVHQYMC